MKTRLIVAFLLFSLICPVASGVRRQEQYRTATPEPTIYAIDVSKYSGFVLPSKWLHLRHAMPSCTIAITSGWQGLTKNEYAQQQLRGARWAKMKTGAYCYLNFNTYKYGSVAKQVRAAFEATGTEARYLSLMAIDVENKYPGHSTSTQRAADIQQAIEEIKHDHPSVLPVIYSTSAYWHDLVGNSHRFSASQVIALWGARFDDEPYLAIDHKKKWTQFGGWSARTGKQYSTTDPGAKNKQAPAIQKLIGISNLDLSVFRSDFLNKKAVVPAAHFQWLVWDVNKREVKRSNTDVVVRVRLHNVGSQTATKAGITKVTLGNVAPTSIPTVRHTLESGESTTYTLTFPAAKLPSKAQVLLRIEGKSQEGSILTPPSKISIPPK